MEYFKQGRVLTNEQHAACRDGRAMILSAEEYSFFLYCKHRNEEYLNPFERQQNSYQSNHSHQSDSSAVETAVKVGASGLIGYALGRSIASIK
jgi:hypothetical protein